jgi:hypothetical protein
MLIGMAGTVSNKLNFECISNFRSAMIPSCGWLYGTQNIQCVEWVIQNQVDAHFG